MFGLYLHVPFCLSRCSYCDFAAAVYDERVARAYFRAVETEMEAAALTAGGETADTLYLGGGTPAAVGAPALLGLITRLRAHFRITPWAEVTCEANPDSLGDEVLSALAAAGVNRLSIGVQTFDDGALRILERRHDAATAEDAYWRARAAGFDNVSLDLMYALPDMDAAAGRGDLERAAALRPDHISLYALTLEPGVKLARERGRRSFPDDDEQGAAYYAAKDLLETAGFVHYEISNFASPGRECRHNLKYWRDVEYIALGPAAASHWGGGRYRNPAGIDEYGLAAATGRWPLGDAEPSDAYREMRTAVVLALRLVAGFDPAGFQKRFDVNPLVYYGREFEELAAAGLLEVTAGNVRLSRRGLFLSDEVFARLI